MTARDSQFGPMGETCQAAINGRRAVKVLGHWARLFQLSEPELQILWLLGCAAGSGVDQTTVATRLAFSPAQVSACVEKLRSRGLIAHLEVSGDRRRRLWQPSQDGIDVLERIVQAAGVLRGAAA